MWASGDHDAGPLLDGVPEFLGHELREDAHQRKHIVEGAEGVVPTGSTDRELGTDETEARELLADVGFDPVLGARPLRRAIQREIEDALSERILFGELQPGQVVTVGVTGEGKDRKFTFNGE